MSAFRNAVREMVGKNVYVVLAATPVQAKLISVTDDLAVVQPTDPSVNYKLAIHVDNLVFAFN